MDNFDFLVGKFHVHNRRKRARSLMADLDLIRDRDWEEFPATNTGSSYLGGQVIVDELKGTYPDGRPLQFVDIHAFDPTTGEWSNVIHGVGAPPDWAPLVGRFSGGIGEFHQVVPGTGGRTVHVRHTWDRITDHTARFQQAFSTDSHTWDVNWIMELTRVPSEPPTA